MNLSETTLLLTRPEPASRRFAKQAVSAFGPFARIVVSALLRIEPIAAKDLPDADEELAFTSENGISALVAQQPPAGRRAWCVGSHTAERACSAGYSVETAGGNVASLSALIRRSGTSAPIVHVAGRHRRGNLVAELRVAGFRARALVVYDQTAMPLSDTARTLLGTPMDVVAPVFSPRSAHLLSVAAIGRRARLHSVAISAATAADWVSRPGEQMEIAPTPDTEGMLVAMGRLFDADRSA